MATLRKIGLTAILVLILFVFGGTAIFCVVGSYQAIHPSRQAILKTPEDYGLEYQNIEFTTSDGLTLKGWWIPNESTSVIVVAHGYGANRAGWSGKDTEGRDEYIDWIAGTVPLYHAGHSILLFDLRGSGESEGDRVTFGYDEAKDVTAAIQWLLEQNRLSKNFPTEHVGLLGFSMGGNVVLRAATKAKKLVEDGELKSLAVVSIGPNIYNTMIDKSMKYWSGGIPAPAFVPPFLKKSVSIRLGFDVIEEINPTRYVSQISPVPVMYIQSEKDEIGDLSDVSAMFEASGEPKEIIIIPDALRFEHYKYPAEHPERVIAFFANHLSGN